MVRKRSGQSAADKTSEGQEVGGGTGRGGQRSTAARPQQVGGRGEGYQGARGARGGAQRSQAGGHRAQVDAGEHYQGQGRGVVYTRGRIASMQHPGSSAGSHGPGHGISQASLQDGPPSAGYHGHGRGGSQPQGGMILPQNGGPHGENQGRGVPPHGMQFQQPGNAMLESRGSFGGDHSSSGPSAASPELYQATVASQQPSVFLEGPSSLPASSTEVSPRKLVGKVQMLSLQSGGTSTQAFQSSSEVMRLPPPPGMGRIGTKCLLKANHFLAELPDKEIYQYDVSIKPEGTSWVINRAVMKNLVKLYKESHLGKRLLVYDGQKSLYTSGPLPFTSKVFSVTLVDEETEKTARRERQFTITIKEAGCADLHHLGLFLQGRQYDTPQHAVQALDIVLRELPTFKYCPVGISFYSPDLGRRQSLGEGLESWRGFYQSIRPTQMGLSLNVDMATTAFFEPLVVTEFVKQILNRNDLSRPLSDVECLKIKKALRNVKIEVTHQRNVRRKYRVLGLTSQATQELGFPIEGVTKSVIEYFQETYGHRILHTALPCLQVGNPQRPNYMPMEVCKIVEGQRYSKKLNKKQITALLKATCQRPDTQEKEGWRGFYQSIRPTQMGLSLNVGLAIGPCSRELYDEIEQLTLSQISIRHCSWREVPDQEKDILWEDIKKKFPLRDSTKHVYMKIAAVTWRKKKSVVRGVEYIYNRDYTNSTNLPLTPNPSKDEGPSDYMPESVNCKILGVGGEVVGYGIRTPTGTMGVVHGHQLDATEVKVLLMKIVDPTYPVWRKAQGGAEILGGITKGGYVYWHKDLLAPMDNYDE